MRTMKSVLALIAVVLGTPASGETDWAYVPSALDARSLGVIAVPDSPNEASISLVGAGPAVLAAPIELRRVVAVDVSSPRALDDVNPAPTESTEYRIPEGARWPDSSGRIVAVLPGPGGASKSAGIRNPWEVRIHLKPVGNDTVFACGGIVSGGPGGSVALLNGSVVRSGEALGEFRVAGVLSGDVVLTKGGLFFVIPIGKSVTVSTVDG
jgi:hypothetical protein